MGSETVSSDTIKERKKKGKNRKKNRKKIKRKKLDNMYKHLRLYSATKNFF